MHAMHSLPTTTRPELSPAAREALYATGHRLLCQDRHTEAAAVFRIMLRLVPTDERAWLALGECHEQTGHRGVALELYTAGTVAAANSYRCQLARFRLLHDDGRTEEADRAFDRAVELAERSEDDDPIRLLEHERELRP